MSDESTVRCLETLADFDLLEPSSGVHLRHRVDAQLSEGAQAFLEAFGQVYTQLDHLQAHLNAMNLCCQDISDNLQSANTGTTHLLEQANGLRQQKASTTLKHTVVAAFLSRFALSPAELAALTSASVPVGSSVFSAMDKVQRIRSDCQLLLTATAEEGDDHTKAGLDILHSTSSQLDQAYQKLHKWALFQVRGFTRIEVEVPPTLRQAIERLKQRDDLLNEVLDVLASTRSASILAHFIEALTRGGPSGLPRPIELHAHDPIRYVGDMLAWVHQAMAGEREFLESFFGLKHDNRLPGAPRRAPSDQEEDELRVRKLMDRNLEGCGRPLKMRIQQTIKSQEGSLMAYKISNLVGFYNVTIERTVGKEALMSQVLVEIAEAALQAFYTTLDASGRTLLRYIQPPPADLSAPMALRDVLLTLKDIMDVYQSALLDNTEPLAAFDLVLERALGPAEEICKRMAELKPSAWDQNVFMLNCLSFIKSVLEPYSDFTSGKIASLQSDIDAKFDQLVNEHYQSLLRQSGLEPIIKVLDSREDNTPLARLPQSNPDALSAALKQFDSMLATSLLSAPPRLSLVASSRIAGDIQQQALVVLSQSYARLHDAVMSGQEGYEFGSTRMRRSVEEVRTLFGITGA